MAFSVRRRRGKRRRTADNSNDDITNQGGENNAQVMAIIMTAMQSPSNTDISSLSENVDALARGLRHWNIAYLICLGLTVLMSFGTLVFSALIVWWNIKLFNEQTKLVIAKEGAFNQKLSDANERAAKALEAAATAELKRAEMAKALTPRVVVLRTNDKDKTTNFDGLKPFAGMQAVIRYAPTADGEAQHAAEGIRDVLKAANWEVVKFEPWQPLLNNPQQARAGVLIESYDIDWLAKHEMSVVEAADAKRSLQAAKSLSDFLETFNWTVWTDRWMWAWRDAGFEAIPPNTVRINVLPKFLSYFVPQESWEKEMWEAIERDRKEMLERLTK